MADVKSSRSEDLEFDGEAMADYEDGYCWLVALDDWDIAIILSSLRYAHWRSRWRTLGSYIWDEIDAKITYLEHCLMAGCNVDELLDRFDTLNSTLTSIAARLLSDSDKGLADVLEDKDLSCGDVEVNFDTSSIVNAIGGVGSAIEAQTESQEDISTAEVTAMSNNFLGLNTTLNDNTAGVIEAIEGLEFNCAPDVNVNCGGGGCGGDCGTGGGPNAPSQPGIEGEEPPIGWTPPAEIDDRKCKAANLITDKIYSIIQTLDDNNITAIAETLGIGTAVGVVAAALATVTGVGGFILAIAGVVVGVVLVFVAQTIDLEGLMTLINNNKEDLVCALYNSTNSTDAINDFLQVLEDAGATFGQMSLMNVIFIADVANALYFSQDTPAGDEFEAELDGYEGSVNCENCLGECVGVVVVGSGDANTSGTITGEEESQGGGHTYYRINVNYKDGDDNWCVRTIKFSDFTNFTYSQPNLPNALTIYGADENTILYQSWNTPPDPDDEYETCAFDFWSEDTNPSVDITIVEE